MRSIILKQANNHPELIAIVEVDLFDNQVITFICQNSQGPKSQLIYCFTKDNHIDCSADNLLRLYDKLLAEATRSSAHCLVHIDCGGDCCSF